MCDVWLYGGEIAAVKMLYISTGNKHNGLEKERRRREREKRRGGRRRGGGKGERRRGGGVGGGRKEMGEKERGREGRRRWRAGEKRGKEKMKTAKSREYLIFCNESLGFTARRKPNHNESRKPPIGHK